MKKSKAKGRGIISYKSYMFREKDPIIGAIRTAMSDAHVTYTTVAAESGVSAATIRNWDSGDTKRPQHATVAAVGRALGKKGVLWSANGPKLID